MSRPFSPKQRKRLAYATAIGTLLAGVGGLYPTLWQDLQAKNDEVNQAQSDLNALPNYASRIRQLQLNLADIQKQASARLQDMPIAENVSTMLVELEGISRSRKTEISSFFPLATGSVAFIAPAVVPKKHGAAPGAATGSVAPAVAAGPPLPQYWEQRVELKANGDYHALHDELAALETYHHPLSIRTIDFAPVAQQTGKPGATTTATGSSRTAPPMAFDVAFAAYMLDKAPADNPPLGKAFADLLPAAEEKEGIANPFVEFLQLFHPKAVPGVAPPPLPSVAASRSAPPDLLAAWHVVGILSSDEAVVSNGGESQTVRAGDQLAGWTVTAVSAGGVTLHQGDRTRVLALPQDGLF